MFPINSEKPLVAAVTMWAYFRQLSGTKIYSVTTQAEETVLLQVGYRSGHNDGKRYHVPRRRL